MSIWTDTVDMIYKLPINRRILYKLETTGGRESHLSCTACGKLLVCKDVEGAKKLIAIHEASCSVDY